MNPGPAHLTLSKNSKSGLWELRDDKRKKLIASFVKRKDALQDLVLVGRKKRWGIIEAQDKSGTWEQRRFGRWPSKKTEGWM